MSLDNLDATLPPSDQEDGPTRTTLLQKFLPKGTLLRRAASRSIQSALSDQAAPQVRAAIARAAQAGLPPARQREAEAQLRQRDAAAAERLCICASATPFSLAAYQDALNTAVRSELFVNASCASIVDRRRHDAAQALTAGMYSMPAFVLQEHLDTAREFGLGREAEECRAALSARQAAAAFALERAANQAEALAFSEALRLV
ncbi:g10485 [Coccomyxa viridis]|uniref:G10485 protein n=1 Tax=Coccomyxa viridis TaxID=1274662 RepID=A0ABP1G9P9_9CHLO